MRIMRMSEVINTTGLCRSSIYNRMAEDGFPRPVPLGGRTVGPTPRRLQDSTLDTLTRPDTRPVRLISLHPRPSTA
jgi:prophage regulatory protein